MKGEVNGNNKCGKHSPAYIADSKARDMKIGEMKEFVKICLYDGAHSCAYSIAITITRCPGDYFVYRLPESEISSNVVYCGHK